MSSETDQMAIERTLSEWADALRTGDVETLSKLVTEDAEFWTHGAPPLSGREAVKEAFAPLFAKYELEQRFDRYELLISGDLAFMRGMEVNRLIPRDGSEPVERRQRGFSILRRDTDGWWRFARGMTNLPPQ